VPQSVEQFLEQLARRGSWVGGGSVAAMSAALAAGLTEKLTVERPARRRLTRIRRECLALIQRDARTFARVVLALRSNSRAEFRRRLREATDVPCRVFEHARAVEAACERARKTINPKFQSDLRCAVAVARAAAQSASALIKTNLAWLNEPSYTRQILRRLASHPQRFHGAARR
jgi:formiminotetrahydrofolate cyclodeaminase